MLNNTQAALFIYLSIKLACVVVPATTIGRAAVFLSISAPLHIHFRGQEALAISCVIPVILHCKNGVKLLNGQSAASVHSVMV